MIELADPQYGDPHLCPNVCHHCPGIRNAVLPFCLGSITALNEYDLTHCTCVAVCECGKPKRICTCEPRPLFVRQLEIVSAADQALRRHREAVERVDRVQKQLNRAFKQATASPRSHSWHVEQWWKVLREITGGRR